LEDSLSSVLVTAVTDTNGYYCASLVVGPGSTQGQITGWTMDCNSNNQYAMAFYSPGTTSLTMNFSICNNVIGGSNCNVTIGANPTGSGWTLNALGSGAQPLTYAWILSNGTTYSSQIIQLSGLPAGMVQACVVITDANGCTSTACDSISFASSQCSSSFVYDTTSVLNQIQFTSTVSGIAPFTYAWDFGDGNTSSAANPLHQFSNGSAYGVSLQVTDSAGCVSGAYDTVYTGPVACNVYAGSNGNGLSVNFWGSMYGVPPMTYSWNFGDGNTASTAYASHTYATAGTYTATLIATDSYGCTDTATVVYNANTAPPCNAMFSYQSSPLNSIYYFASGQSSGSNLSYLWDFGDNTTSTSANPSHYYSSFGSYNVCLTVSDPFGCSSTYCDSIVAGMQPTCAVYINQPNPTALGAVFSSVPTGTAPFTYQWTLPDSSTSTMPNPFYGPMANGTYTVCVSVTDANGCVSTNCLTFTVNLIFICNPGIAIIPDTAAIANGTFTFDFYANAPTIGVSYSWDFGDSTWTNVPNPSHTYAGYGWYQICLNIYDSVNNCYGNICDTLVLDSNFALNPVTVGFNYQNLGNNTVIFTNTSGFAPINSLHFWDFGDGTTSTIENPTHQYAAEGDYTVCLMALAEDGFYYSHCEEQVEVLAAIGITELQSKISNVYPNPAENVIYIDLYDSMMDVTIDIYDLQGKKHTANWSNLGNKLEIDSSVLSAGVYIIRLQSESEMVNLKLIKQ